MNSTDTTLSREEFVAEVNGMLEGSYDATGVARWWRRPRTALSGQTPLAVIGDSEQLDRYAAQRVRRLAATLAGPGNAT